MWINRVRYIAAVSSGATMVTSTGLVALAIVLRDHLLPYQDFMLFYTKFLAMTIVAVGSVDFLVAVVGLLASLRKIHRLLLTVGVFLGITLTVKISILSVAFLLRSGEWLSVDSCFKNQMLSYNSRPSLIDGLQISLRCCGERNPDEWLNVTGYIPASCCRDTETGKPCLIDEDTVNVGGCVQKLEGLVPQDWLIVMAILLVIQEAIQISSIGITTYLASKLASEETNLMKQEERCESESTSRSELHRSFDDYFLKRERMNSQKGNHQTNGKVRSKGQNRNPLANADTNWIM